MFTTLKSLIKMLTGINKQGWKKMHPARLSTNKFNKLPWWIFSFMKVSHHIRIIQTRPMFGFESFDGKLAVINCPTKVNFKMKINPFDYKT